MGNPGRESKPAVALHAAVDTVCPKPPSTDPCIYACFQCLKREVGRGGDNFEHDDCSGDAREAVEKTRETRLWRQCFGVMVLERILPRSAFCHGFARFGVILHTPECA